MEHHVPGRFALERDVDEQHWEVTPYTPEISDEALALCQREWGDIEITDGRYVRWQYEENPAGKSLSVFARDGRLIGQFGVVPVWLNIDGVERLSGLALNVVTDAEHRRRGIFAGLGRAADELMEARGVDIAWALPNENSFPGFIRRLGYQHVGDVPLLVRPVNIRRLVSNRLPIPGAGTVGALLSRPFAPPLPATALTTDGVSIETIDRFDGRFDALSRRIATRQRVMVRRDAARLNWRFRDIPLRHYDSFSSFENGELTGYIVTRLSEIAGMKAGLIVDFIAENEKAGRALLSQALLQIREHDVDLLASLMLPKALEYQLLRRFRFRPLPRPLLPQRFRVVARGAPAVTDLGNWFLTMGDYDVV